MSYNTYPQNPFPPNSENAGGGSSYTLPIASTTELGGVKVGSGLAINAETGVLTPSNDVIRQDDIALPFNANSAYLAGDFCFYENTLYRFEVDHDGEWDANDVFAVRVCDSIISEFGDGLRRMSNSISVKIKNDGGLAFNSNGELYVTEINDYSTTEKNIGKKWIDGSDIYQKVLNVGDLGVSGDGTYSHGIANFKNIISFNCIGISNDGYSFCNNGVILLSATNTTISYRKTFDTTGYNSYFVVEYTKTA